tara:strand:+ start:660 stop:1076 length:417 start_codon:yes stop_codon:yes gene_type:complete
MEHLKQKLDGLLRKEQVMLALECATVVTGIRRGLNPIQQSLFNTPWGKAPESEEEQFHQDLVWVYKVLPPNDQFDPKLAEKGVYKKLRLKALADFWSNYDPEKQEQRPYTRHIPKKNNNPRQLVIKPPTFRCRGTENV